jgi:hypothetical protein
VVNWRFPKAVHPLTGPWFRHRFPKSTTPAQAARGKVEKLVEFNGIIDAARQHLATPEGMSDALNIIRQKLAHIRATGFPVIAERLAAMDEYNERLEEETTFLLP